MKYLLCTTFSFEEGQAEKTYQELKQNNPEMNFKEFNTTSECSGGIEIEFEIKKPKGLIISYIESFYRKNNMYGSESFSLYKCTPMDKYLINTEDDLFDDASMLHFFKSKGFELKSNDNFYNDLENWLRTDLNITFELVKAFGICYLSELIIDGVNMVTDENGLRFYDLDNNKIGTNFVFRLVHRHLSKIPLVR